MGSWVTDRTGCPDGEGKRVALMHVYSSHLFKRGLSSQMPRLLCGGLCLDDFSNW